MFNFIVPIFTAILGWIGSSVSRKHADKNARKSEILVQKNNELTESQIEMKRILENLSCEISVSADSSNKTLIRNSAIEMDTLDTLVAGFTLLVKCNILRGSIKSMFVAYRNDKNSDPFIYLKFRSKDGGSINKFLGSIELNTIGINGVFEDLFAKSNEQFLTNVQGYKKSLYLVILDANNNLNFQTIELALSPISQLNRITTSRVNHFISEENITESDLKKTIHWKLLDYDYFVESDHRKTISWQPFRTQKEKERYPILRPSEDSINSQELLCDIKVIRKHFKDFDINERT